MFTGCRLMDSLSRRSFQTGCEIAGVLIRSVGSGSKPLVMRALVKFPGLYQDLPFIPTWAAVHLLAYDFLGHTMDIQRSDDTLYCATLALGSISLLGRWFFPCQVSCSWFLLHFISLNATGSALLQSSILIFHAVSILFLAVRGPWSSFPFWKW